MSVSNLLPQKLFSAYLLILCWAPLPFASNRPWAWNLLAIMCLLLAAGVFWQALKLRIPFGTLISRHRISVWVLGLVPLWITLQSLPLPGALVGLLSPSAATFFSSSGASWFTFSLEPAFTQQMALMSWVYWLFFIMTLVLVDSAKRLRLLLSVIVLSGLFQALYGSYMTLSGVEYSFLMPKASYVGNATGTFINRNHLAGYLEMCLAVGIGLLVASMRSDGKKSWRQHAIQLLDTFLGPKVRLRVYLGIMVIALVLTRSRMGNTAFFVSLPICGMLLMMLQGKFNRNAIILFASLLFIDFFIVGQWFGFEELAERIQTTSIESESRDEVAMDTWRMFTDYPVTGTGAGTFYSSFPQYHRDYPSGFNEHTHNDYLEFASTLGVIGFLPMILTVLLAVSVCVEVMYNRRDKLMKGAAFGSLMAIVSLSIHSFVDFNLQMPANAMLFIVLLAVAHISRSLPGNGGKMQSSGLSIG